MAQAVFALENTLPDYLYNVGTGEDLTIKQLKPSKNNGHQGEIIWDSSKPDGTPRKLMDISKMHGNTSTIRRRNRKHTIGFGEYRSI
jgi:GDP-L-fucose synthase